MCVHACAFTTPALQKCAPTLTYTCVLISHTPSSHLLTLPTLKPPSPHTTRTQRADGAYKSPKWTVFWRGLQDDAIMPCVKEALAIKPTFNYSASAAAAPEPIPMLVPK